MYALLVTADVEPGYEEEGLEYLRPMLPQLEQIPGLLSGYWLATTKDGESLAIVLFENEEAAEEMAQVGLPTPLSLLAQPSVGRRCERSLLISKPRRISSS